ncbi:Alpha/Beta hydrolase protein [Stachybotrys elegans]|uniref:Alpha/Beta hydrolase protein n=1 Tax=Stachybotrys elegans TaxID=80388 RepID=A0A8K0SWT9_9HYPO|nr:Alpha/Beta hydrolase protein [Stachybotrys elegans]
MRLHTSLFPLFAGLALSQVFIPPPEGLTRVPSQLFRGAEISYKKTSICETTEGVNAYSGYVKLPKNLLPDASDWPGDAAAHMFFWYFEARQDSRNAPTSIYLGGGPGTSSFDGASDFPCFVNADSNSTTINEFSWNNRVNMLYIDQPVHTGFSYITLQNGTYDFLTDIFTPIEDPDDLPPLNVTTRQATLDPHDTPVVNNTASAARTIWAFSQVWFNEFPQWQTENNEISLWTQSYGGFYGPKFFEYFQEQNDLTQADEPTLANATIFNLATLGLADACIDARAMAAGYPTFAFNNTYGLEIYPEDVYNQIMERVTDQDTGCYGLVDRCRALAAEGDPLSFGNNQTVNEACVAATQLCFVELQGAYQALSDRNPFDVTVSNLTLPLLPYKDAFFNQRWVQQDLGVPVNFTGSSIPTVGAFFGLTGDPMRQSLTTLEKVLDRGVNVAMIYGDRDYRCQWYGGENVSLSLEFSTSEAFRNAGYEPIITNSSYEGGLVREQGKLSFSRIFQAGHGVAGYQPETLSRVFDRAMFGRDVATGNVDLSQRRDYATRGPSTVYDVLNTAPEAIENTCLVVMASFACTPEQLVALADGGAVVEDFVVVEPRGAKPIPMVSKNPSSSNNEGRGEDEPSKANGNSALTSTGLATALSVAAAFVLL